MNTAVAGSGVLWEVVQGRAGRQAGRQAEVMKHAKAPVLIPLHVRNERLQQPPLPTGFHNYALCCPEQLLCVMQCIIQLCQRTAFLCLTAVFSAALTHSGTHVLRTALLLANAIPGCGLDVKYGATMIGLLLCAGHALHALPAGLPAGHAPQCECQHIFGACCMLPNTKACAEIVSDTCGTI